MHLILATSFLVRGSSQPAFSTSLSIVCVRVYPVYSDAGFVQLCLVVVIRNKVEAARTELNGDRGQEGGTALHVPAVVEVNAHAVGTNL